jgi:hypothetical protein
VNTSTENAALGPPEFAVLSSVTSKFPDVAVRSKKMAQFGEPLLLEGPGLAFSVCAHTLPGAAITAAATKNFEMAKNEGLMGLRFGPMPRAKEDPLTPRSLAEALHERSPA